MMMCVVYTMRAAVTLSHDQAVANLSRAMRLLAKLYRCIAREIREMEFATVAGEDNSKRRNQPCGGGGQGSVP
jgi:hypothetical protein